MSKYTSGKWKKLTIFDDGINQDMPDSIDIERAHRNLTFKMIDQYGNEVSGYIGSVHPRFISLFKTAPELLEACKDLTALWKIQKESNPKVLEIIKEAKQAIAKAEGRSTKRI